MSAETLPVTAGVLREQRRSLILWAIAVAAVSAIYTGFWPAMSGNEMEELIANMPEALVTALGYDQIGSPGGYLTSTVFGLLAPILLLVFAITNGARLIAGQEEDGTLELELAAPIARRRLLTERLVALWFDLVVLVAAVFAVTSLLAAALDMGVGLDRLLAGTIGLLLLTVGFGTLAFAVGAVTGRRGSALAVAAAVAVLSFMFDALGPVVELDWMTAVSPFSWYLGGNPLVEGFDLGGLALLAVVPAASAAVALAIFDRRDLGV